jgi:hypothetical protein
LLVSGGSDFHGGKRLNKLAHITAKNVIISAEEENLIFVNQKTFKEAFGE